MLEQLQVRPVGYIRDLWSMTKPGINALVLITTAGGYGLASGGELWDPRLVWVLVGTGLVVASASLVNHLMEQETDARMERTSDRPLPAGRVSRGLVVRLASLLGFGGLVVLLWGTTWPAAGLAVVAYVSYVPLYTYAKKFTSLATLIGAIPGAIPPVIGWAAVTGSIGLPAVLLFGIMFLWQPPHFLALALMLKQDYKRAELPMLPVEQDDGMARRQILIYLTALLPVSLFPVVLGISGWIYGFSVGFLGLAYVILAGYGALGSPAGESWARWMFFYSIVYLFVLFGLLFFDPTEVIVP